MTSKVRVLLPPPSFARSASYGSASPIVAKAAAPKPGESHILGSDMLSFLAEFWMFLRVRKKFWLLPIFIMMLLFGSLLVLSKGSAVAPFIYAIF
ncbi:hypothetical protein ABIE49_001104 [Bradyrhizobium sp. OAE829]